MVKEKKIALHVKGIMEALGLDLKDDSLKDTPKRVAKAYARELFVGLDQKNFPRSMTVENKFGYTQMLVEKGIDVFSVCEHHLLPIVGQAKVAYVPRKKVIGLSKLNRLVDFYSRRPQVQERLTELIKGKLQELVDSEDVAVMIEAKHYCVAMRGVSHTNCTTITTSLGGIFLLDSKARQEFISL